MKTRLPELMWEERGRRRRRRHRKREAATAKLLFELDGKEGERGNGKGGDEDLVLAC